MRSDPDCRLPRVICAEVPNRCQRGFVSEYCLQHVQSPNENGDSDTSLIRGPQNLDRYRGTDAHRGICFGPKSRRKYAIRCFGLAWRYRAHSFSKRAPSGTRRRPDAKATHNANDATVSNPVMFDRLLLDLPKVRLWWTWRLSTALIEEGDGQKNRRLASFPFCFLNGPSEKRAVCAQKCAQMGVPKTSSKPTI